MAVKLKHPFTIYGETGVTASSDGIPWDGGFPVVQTISVDNDITITGNVQFNALTASSYDLGGFKLIGDRWTQDFSAGSVITTSNIIIPGNATISGKITAEKIEAELTSSSVIYKSGSTQFGDSIDDNHYMTGSVYHSGSLNLFGTNITEFSTDISLAGNSATALMTESASMAYTLNELGGSDTATTTDIYLRKSYNKVASIVSNNTASFHSAFSASSPSGITSTTESDYLFFNNGQIMEHDALSIEQSGSTFYLKVNPNDIGYNLANDDEIKAWGKFEPVGELKFDGVNDRIKTTFSGSSGQGTHIPSPKTYSFWAKSSTTGRNYSIFGWGDNKKSFTFNFHASRVLRWYNSNWYLYWDNTPAQDDGQWHHWMVYDSPADLSLSKIYVDGTLLPINQIVDTSGVGAANYLQNFTIGAYRNDSDGADAHFSGSIKEFSVFGGDKTSFASTYYNNGTPYDVTNETGLQAYWKMSEGVGTTVYDYSNNTDSNGNRYDGTIDGATWEAIE